MVPWPDTNDSYDAEDLNDQDFSERDYDNEKYGQVGMFLLLKKIKLKM